MPLTFNGGALKGVPLEFTPAAPAYEFIRTKFSGVRGVSEIAGGSGMRAIEIPVILYGKFKTRTALQQYIETTLNSDNGGALGVNSVLTYSAPGNNSFYFAYTHCTFEGFTLRGDPGMLLDEAGTLDGGWWCLGVLKFTQLTVQ